MAWNKQWNKQWLTETWILTFIHYLMMKCTLIRACWSGPAWWCWYWWCDDSQCSSTPHHHTTPHHISTLSQVPAVPASQRRTLSQSQGYPAPAASLLSAAVLLRRTRGSQPQLALIALVTLSHSRDISLQLWPTSEHQTQQTQYKVGPNTPYDIVAQDKRNDKNFCLLIFKSPLPLKSP